MGVRCWWLVLLLMSCSAGKQEIQFCVFDGDAQPPLVGAELKGYNLDDIVCKGIIVSEDSSMVTVVDTVEMQNSMDYGFWKDKVQPYRCIDCTLVNREQYWCALFYLKGQTTYYLRAFVKDHEGSISYSDVKTVTTKQFNRHPGYVGYANVYYWQDYTLFDKMTDEVIDPEKDGFYYSRNENPNSCKYQHGAETKNTNYKFKTEWSYLLWFYKQANQEEQPYKQPPVMYIENGKVVISAADNEKVFYKINDTSNDPATFTEIYTEPLDVPEGSRIDCYSVNDNGELSYLNRYWRR